MLLSYCQVPNFSSSLGVFVAWGMDEGALAKMKSVMALGHQYFNLDYIKMIASEDRLSGSESKSSGNRGSSSSSSSGAAETKTKSGAAASSSTDPTFPPQMHMRFWMRKQQAKITLCPSSVAVSADPFAGAAEAEEDRDRFYTVSIWLPPFEKDDFPARTGPIESVLDSIKDAYAFIWDMKTSKVCSSPLPLKRGKVTHVPCWPKEWREAKESENGDEEKPKEGDQKAEDKGTVKSESAGTRPQPEESKAEKEPLLTDKEELEAFFKDSKLSRQVVCGEIGREVSRTRVGVVLPTKPAQRKACFIAVVDSSVEEAQQEEQQTTAKAKGENGRVILRLKSDPASLMQCSIVVRRTDPDSVVVELRRRSDGKTAAMATWEDEEIASLNMSSLKIEEATEDGRLCLSFALK